MSNYGIYMDRQAAMQPFPSAPAEFRAKMAEIAGIEPDDQKQFLEYLFAKSLAYRQWARGYHAILNEPMTLDEVDFRDCEAV